MVINFKWLLAIFFLTFTFSLYAQIDNDDKKPFPAIKKSAEAE